MNNLKAEANELVGGSRSAAPAKTKRKDDWQTTKRGYNFYEVLSAFQKAIRRGDGKLAGYWALELYDSGFETHVWNRLRIIACEDIAEPVAREIEALKQSHDFVNKGKKKGEPEQAGPIDGRQGNAAACSSEEMPGRGPLNLSGVRRQYDSGGNSSR